MADARARQARYSKGSMVFHWVTAVAVIANWQIVERAEDLSRDERGSVMSYHFALGMTILLLTVLRLMWRAAHPAPPFAPTVKVWERALARTVHFTFYLLLIGLPLGGWLGLSFFQSPISFWGLFDIPMLPVSASEDRGEGVLDLHESGGSLMLWLIALHVAGALKHTLIDRDGEIFRMLPFGRPTAP